MMILDKDIVLGFWQFAKYIYSIEIKGSLLKLATIWYITGLQLADITKVSKQKYPQVRIGHSGIFFESHISFGWKYHCEES